MDFQENVPIGRKTTMRIGGNAKYYAEIRTKEECEAAFQFATQKQLPVVVFGGGSNTVFANGTIDAVVMRPKADAVTKKGSTVTVEAGKNLAMLVNELAKEGLDLSALTGIPGCIGGAIFGNAGQGPSGIWIDAYVQQVTAYTKNGWQDYTRNDCTFGYRDSLFKQMAEPICIWEIVLEVPKGDANEIEANIQRLLQKRLETQPHVKTAGSCFKAVGDVPAWKLIDAVGFRGTRIGDVHVSEKHANFLLNDGAGTFSDALALVQKIEGSVTETLDIEMRFIQNDGSLAF